jgi:alkylation response protein AidB-like acyl-CoA dehydrogenase
MDTLSYCLVVEEIGRVDSNVRGIVSVSNGLVGKTVARWGTEEQRRRYLPGLAAGEALGCYALTEPGAGSDPGGLETRAVRDGSDWVLSGQKIFITLGTWAAFALVFARTGGEGARGISCFLVPTDAPGFEARKIHGKLGLRAQDTAELFLDGVRVPADALLGEEGQGFKVAMSALDHGRISLGAGCVGIAQGCLDASVAYARERRQFGRSIARFQLVQELPRTWPSRPRRRGCSSGGRRSPPTPAGRTRPSRRSPSTTRARSPSAPRTPRCRCTAATATSTSTPSASTCATRA